LGPSGASTRCMVGNTAGARAGGPMVCLGRVRNERLTGPDFSLAPQHRARLWRLGDITGAPLVVLRTAPGGGLLSLEPAPFRHDYLHGLAPALVAGSRNPLRPGLAGNDRAGAVLRPVQARRLSSSRISRSCPSSRMCSRALASQQLQAAE